MGTLFLLRQADFDAGEDRVAAVFRREMLTRTPDRARYCAAMAKQNVEVVRRFYERWSKRDLAGVLDCAHTEFQFDWSASQAPFGGIYSGHEGFGRFWTEHNDVWEEFELDITDVVECPDDRVITVTVVRGRGRGSGVRIEGTGAVLWTLREGRVLNAELFQSKAEALEAVGLSE